MSRPIHIGEVSIPLDSYVVGGTAVLGIRESGKTYLAKGIAEQLLEQSIPIIVFDAIGVWRYLRVAGAGERAKAFKIVVAGGKEPDLPLTPDSAPEIVRAAIRENIPLVIDLYDKKLSKADWRKIVQRCFRTLLYENEGLRHIFLEETAEYAPQKVFDGETYAEVEKLVRMGGNASLGITLINQRSQEVNKAVLDLCENLVLMRQRGAHAIDALQKWMDKIAPEQAKEIAAEMPKMGQGDAWIFSGDAEHAVRTRSKQLRSFHPDRRKPQLRALSAGGADTSDFVQRMAGELGKLIEQQKASDPSVLKRRVAELERQLHAKAPAQASTEQLARAQQRGFDRANAAAFQYARALVRALKDSVASEFTHALDQFVARPENPVAVSNAESHTRHTTALDSPGRASAPGAARARQIDGRATSSSIDKPMPRAFLTTLAQHHGGLTKGQILVHTGYRSSGPVSACFAELVRNGWAEAKGAGGLAITDAGLEALGPYEPLPTGEELRRHLLNGGKCSVMEKRMLEALFDVYPESIAKGTILEKTGYASSGPVSAAFARLVALGYAQQTGRSALRASKDFFE